LIGVSVTDLRQLRLQAGQRSARTASTTAHGVGAWLAQDGQRDGGSPLKVAQVLTVSTLSSTRPRLSGAPGCHLAR
jgi:hypothetical protein